jgi:hypothetical protein
MRVWMLVLAGCGAEVSEEADMAALAQGDLEELARTSLELVRAVAGEVPDGAEPSTEQLVALAQGFDGIGDCTWEVVYDGQALGGVIDAALASTPCGGDSADGLGYELTAGRMEGIWAWRGEGVWRLDFDAERDATVTVGGLRRGGRSYDAAWTMKNSWVDATPTGVVAWNVEATWLGFGGEAWVMQFGMTGEGAAGTITGPDGAACAVSGTLEAPAVVCSAP